jgi:hypothetical protein
MLASKRIALAPPFYAYQLPGARGTGLRSIGVSQKSNSPPMPSNVREVNPLGWRSPSLRKNKKVSGSVRPAVPRCALKSNPNLCWRTDWHVPVQSSSSDGATCSKRENSSGPLFHSDARPSKDGSCSVSNVGAGRVSNVNFRCREKGASSSNHRWSCTRLAELVPGRGDAGIGVGV